MSVSVAQEIEYTRYQLDNGLTVILHQDKSVPLVAVNLWYYGGSQDEPVKRSGFAHLFEHLMFMGTENVPYPQFDQTMERYGGSNNATTSSDRTNYFERGPKELLDLFLFLEADRMAGLGKAMTLDKLNAQREVVRNERRQRYENQPYGRVQTVLPHLLYPKGHPYREPVIGSHEDLEAATVDDVKRFFDQFYFPANASLVVGGDFEVDEAKRLVEKHFGSLGKAPDLKRAEPKTAELTSVVRETMTDAVELPLVISAWHSPGFYQAGDADLDVLADCLSGGKSSRLYKRLVYEKRLAQSVQAYQLSRLLGSEFRVAVFVRPGVSLDEVEAEVDSIIETVRSEGPTDREVARARNTIETMFWRELEGLGRRIDLLNRYQFYYGDPGALERDRERYDAVTRDSVQKWAQEVLKPSRRVVFRVVPENESDGQAAPATATGE